MKPGMKSFVFVIVMVVLFGLIELPQPVLMNALNKNVVMNQAEPQTAEINVLSEGEDGIRFEIKVPWQTLAITSTSSGGKVYSRAALDAYQTISQAGAPALPFLNLKIGAPYGSEILVNVIPGPAHQIALAAPILPAADIDLEWDFSSENDHQFFPSPRSVIEMDRSIYKGSAKFPAQLAEVASDGMIRQQRVAGINVYPIQYDPSGMELLIHESMTVEVRFSGGGVKTNQGQIKESSVYERFFSQNLLNYQTALNWRVSTSDQLISAEVSLDNREIPWSPPEPGWRIKVQEDGIYQLTYAALSAAGLDVDSLDPHTFQMYNLGQELAIWVEGESDDSFEVSDQILFYGQSLNSKYTKDNVYWLTYGNTSQGLRMGPLNDGTPVVSTTPTSFDAKKLVEGNVYYLSQAPGDEYLDRWMWAYISAVSSNLASWTTHFSLNTATSDAALLTISMVGWTSSTAYNPDHHVTIELNGTFLGEEGVYWDGKTWIIEDFIVPEGLLNADGDNELILTCPNDIGAGVDAIFVDWMSLSYQSLFTAENDILAFTYSEPGTWKYQLDGFTTNDVLVFNVTDPWSVLPFSGLQYPGTGAVEFQDEIDEETNYYAVERSALFTISPEAIEQDVPSNLRALEQGADHITITPAAFMEQAEDLRDFRASKGYRAIAVDVQDIYDEFGYGIAGVAPIRDFLSFAYANWPAPAPSYVVLLGDGHYDPKYYMNAKTNFISPYLVPVDPWINETAADNRYVTLMGADTMPDMMLGRLAVNNIAEANAFVQKIINYEGNSSGEDWQKQILAVTDNADSGGNFPSISDNLLSCCLPEPYQATKVYYDPVHTTISETRNAIITGINQGKLIVNYIGHAAHTQWAGEGLFKVTDVAGLTNGTKTPVILAMTCYDGFFHFPFSPTMGDESTAEVVTRAEGKGAVASWSPTGLGVASGHDYLNRGFYDALFTEGVYTIGQATDWGKFDLWSTGSNLDLLDTYLLFGDPATHMPLQPTSIDLLSFDATGETDRIRLDWETANEYDLSGFNLYRATEIDGPMEKINSEMILSLTPPGSPLGAVYTYDDMDVEAGIVYYYWLESIGVSGQSTGLSGPETASLLDDDPDWEVFLPLIIH